MDLEVPYMIGGELRSGQIAKFISSIPAVNVALEPSDKVKRWQARGLMPAARGGLLLWRCCVALGAPGEAEGREIYVGYYGGRMRLGQPFQSVGSMACAGPIGAATLGPRFKDAGAPVEPDRLRLLAVVATDVRESANRGAFYIHSGTPIAAYAYEIVPPDNIDYSRSYSDSEIRMTRVAIAPRYLALDPLGMIGA